MTRTRVRAAVLVLLGAAVIARTVEAGIGGGLGLMLGTLFFLAGLGLLFLERWTGR